MTVREAVLDTLRNADRSLSQVEIATRGDLVASSVRRECQRLERDGGVEQDFEGGHTYKGGPYFKLPQGKEVATTGAAEAYGR